MRNPCARADRPTSSASFSVSAVKPDISANSTTPRNSRGCGVVPTAALASISASTSSTAFGTKEATEGVSRRECSCEWMAPPFRCRCP